MMSSLILWRGRKRLFWIFGKVVRALSPLKGMHKSAIIGMTMGAKMSAPRLSDYPRCSP